MRRFSPLVLCLIFMMMLAACSTKKNTPITRKVQAFKARYNTYYNGHMAYLDGIEAQRTGNKDNCTELIPLFMTANKGTVSLGKANFDKAIEKCKKTIRRHSITARPQAKGGNRRKTQKEKIWMTQKEYNPFLYKAWFLLGEAQFHKGDYMEAASTFAYIQRLYFSKPNIIAKARILEAKCYAELKWYYDAEDLLSRAGRDSIPERLLPVRDAILADCQIGERQYAEAIPNLKNAIRKAQGSYQKARMYFLLGQLYHATGNNEEAYKAFKKVPGKNPPYELAFNARIKMTEVMSGSDSKRMIRKLKSMARNPKNKDYLDQVYYAIGNIHLAQKDTTHAIWAYKDGVEKSTRNSVEKGVVWLHLGQLYWEQEEFVKAKDCYAGALGLFDKEREDYDDVDERTKILEELYPHASAVELQDSLQTLARMDSVQRMEVIHKIIEEVKKKEKEEQKKAAQAAAAANPQNNNANTNRNQMNNTTFGNQNQQGGAQWYFYNSNAVASGKSEFAKKWGNRELADDWRRSNKTVLAEENNQENDEENVEEDEEADNEGEETEGAEGTGGDTGGKAKGGKKGAEGGAPGTDAPEGGAEGADGAQQEQLSEEEQKSREKQAEYEKDPHRPEFYLKDIPFTEEQMNASNAKLVDGLYNSAIIFKDRMENFPLAEKTFKRVLDEFPEFEHKDEIYYNMFQLYARQGISYAADDYKNRLLTEFPDNEHGKVISDPFFNYKARHGIQEEDSLYQDVYEAFKANAFPDVITRAQYAQERYPEGANKARFMFLEAMSQLEVGNRNGFLNLMKSIVEKYPKSTVSELAGLYVKGVREGRILTSGKMEMGSVWDRRAGFLIEGDSALADTAFTAKRDDIHIFVVAYEHNSINENQLLYEMARYNFMNFPVRNFDINIEIGDGIDMLQIRPFLNYDEAYIYQRKMESDEEMAYKMEGLKYFVISDHDLKLITRRGLSFSDYFDFYDETYTEDKLPEYDENLLNEPVERQVEESDKQEEEKKEEQQQEGFDGNVDFQDETDEGGNNNQQIEQGNFLDDFDNNEQKQDNQNQQNNQLEERGEFFDDFDNNEQKQDNQNQQNNQLEERGEFFDDFDIEDKREEERKAEEQRRAEELQRQQEEQQRQQEEQQRQAEQQRQQEEQQRQAERQRQQEEQQRQAEQQRQQEEQQRQAEQQRQQEEQQRQNNQQKQEEKWDGHVEDFDDEGTDANQQNQQEEWDGNVEDFDDEDNTNQNVNQNNNQNWDDEDDEDYIF